MSQKLLAYDPDLADKKWFPAVIPAISVYNSGATFAISTGVNKWTLNAEDLDNTSTFDSTTNYRWTPQVAGWYHVGGIVHGTAGSNGELLALFLYKNGARIRDLGGGPFASASLVQLASGSGLVQMNGTTDYLEWYIYNTAGGATANGSSGSTRYSHAWGYLVASIL